MAKVVKKVTTVEFDSSDVNNISGALAALDIIIMNLEVETDLGSELFTDPKGTVEVYIRDLKRAMKRLETFLPEEIQRF